MRLENGVSACASSPAKYVYASVKNLEKYIKDLGDDRCETMQQSIRAEL